MEQQEFTDERGRKYKVLMEGDQMIPIGPPDIVDVLELPEPVATRLHNILYQRGLFSYKDIAAGKNALGALQEALSIDVQRLVEAFYRFETGGPK